MNKIFNESCLNAAQRLAPKSVNTIVTSPPYYGLRDYGVEGQIGLEQTPQEYVDKLVSVFRACREALRDDGTLWLNLGDSYCSSNGYARAESKWQRQGRNDAPNNDRNLSYLHSCGIKTKDLIGIPWRVAFALQADGWYLRQDIIWHKPNPMPESVKDRCTKAHEYIFMLSKSPRYYFDAEAIQEPCVCKDAFRFTDGGADKQRGHSRRHAGFNGRYAEKIKKEGVPEFRNRRDVWMIATKPCKEAHFATFPPELIRPSILAGAPKHGVVLDPFMGAGTTAMVCKQEHRQYVGFELNQAYIEIARKRIATIPDELEFEIEPPKEDA